MNDSGCNVARHLRIAAQTTPYAFATLTPLSISHEGRVVHQHRSFKILDQESDAAARIFYAHGIHKGTRTLLAVKPGHDLIVCMFALLKLGAVPIAIDPGMGWSKALNCIQHTQPTALVAMRPVALLSRLPFKAFKSFLYRVSVGGSNWRKLLSDCTSATPLPIMTAHAETEAAILFTSGSTGAPKGVNYTHGMLDAQIKLIRQTFKIQPGEVDMAMLPIFALFNPALGMTTVTPTLDPSRPAQADPAPIVAAIRDEKVTNSFGSPAIWGRIAQHCINNNIKLPSLQRLLIAGAPVPNGLLEDLRSIAPNCEIHTPYGATECLPATTIESTEILRETAAATLIGQGTCVGRPVSGVQIKIIQEASGTILNLSDAVECSNNSVGEIIVTGPSVTHSYDQLPLATARAKIHEGEKIWHRMGDLGRIDSVGRLWFHGRCVEKVQAAHGILTTESIEPAFRNHEDVNRCALIGIGSAPKQIPVLVVEPKPESFPSNQVERDTFIKNLRIHARHNALTHQIQHIVFQESLPVDVRHNAKIHRLQLAEEWTRRLTPRFSLKL
jgi:acyl-CoA synthetase (AMP-forming)/AMP-acid ligase II